MTYVVWIISYIIPIIIIINIIANSLLFDMVK